MLAELDRQPGVAESRVDWEGKHILIRLSPGARREDVAARVAPILGRGTTRLSAAAEAERIASFRPGASWMRTGETIKLSQHEARVLGARFARISAGSAKLDATQTVRLETALAEEIGALFERMHASGIRPDDVPAELLRELERVIRERCGDFASASQVEAILRELKSNIGMCEREG